MQRFVESVNWYWKETWKLKDDKDIKADRESSIHISFGKEKEAPSVSAMINWKSSIDIMYDRNSSHIFEPRRTLVASLFVPKCAGVRANYSYEYPKDNPHELEIEYLRLEHWILKMKFPLNQSPERTFKLSAIPRWDAFSFPFEITVKDSENYKVANWSVGLTRKAPTFSFLFKISQLKVGEQIERSATASCEMKSPHLSASTSWEENEVKCSFQHKDGDLLYISEGHLNFKSAKESLCSVALKKTIDESKDIQVAFDTNNTTTIDFSYCVDTKFKFKVCAKVDARDINHSQIKASFTYQ
ncbi:uncharacterized protein LOC108859335 [Raphanus sativus]|uniref:Uncharacterized protein LOC108859335 n=1 Tax=Raphanus sativus TaxID=3726 RepID=A0A6J0NWM1_RAPSA|nr:uncharacterized protein LOC108859335 [Raphanus sativus]XP_018488728.1 uncharacterized protein LOC108859335 [Raphanus sativus]XP_056862549.1 uncharacterized protein LOC108859335 [Raphanus sativus]XP_056862550.1 uncharacterized protein LOC108859335 [Raphanus sativus]